MAKVRTFSSPQNHDKPSYHLARSLPNNFLVRHSNSLDLSFPFYKIEKDTAGDNQMRPMDNQAPASSPQNSFSSGYLCLRICCGSLCSFLSLKLLILFPCLIWSVPWSLTEAQRTAFFLLSAFMFYCTHLTPGYMMPEITMLLFFQGNSFNFLQKAE